MFASLGLPALAGFWSEFLVFVGAFLAIPVHTVASALGLVLTAAFFLWTIQRVLLGPINPEWKGGGYGPARGCGAHASARP